MASRALGDNEIEAKRQINETLKARVNTDSAALDHKIEDLHSRIRILSNRMFETPHQFLLELVHNADDTLFTHEFYPELSFDLRLKLVGGYYHRRLYDELGSSEISNPSKERRQQSSDYHRSEGLHERLPPSNQDRDISSTQMRFHSAPTDQLNDNETGAEKSERREVHQLVKVGELDERIEIIAATGKCASEETYPQRSDEQVADLLSFKTATIPLATMTDSTAEEVHSRQMTELAHDLTAVQLSDSTSTILNESLSSSAISLNFLRSEIQSSWFAFNAESHYNSAPSLRRRVSSRTTTSREELPLAVSSISRLQEPSVPNASSPLLIPKPEPALDRMELDRINHAAKIPSVVMDRVVYPYSMSMTTTRRRSRRSSAQQTKILDAQRMVFFGSPLMSSKSLPRSYWLNEDEQKEDEQKEDEQKGGEQWKASKRIGDKGEYFVRFYLTSAAPTADSSEVYILLQHLERSFDHAWWTGKKSPLGKFADFTFCESTEAWTKLLFEHGYSMARTWPPETKYHLEVKTTASTYDTAFKHSSLQFKMAQTFTIPEYGEPKDVYIIAHVYNIHGLSPRFRLYVDPWSLCMNGQLRYRSNNKDGYMVYPARDNIEASLQIPSTLNDESSIRRSRSTTSLSASQSPDLMHDQSTHREHRQSQALAVPTDAQSRGRSKSTPRSAVDELARLHDYSNISRMA